MGLLKLAGAGLHRTGKGALFVAKEGRLEHSVGDGGAVNRDKGTGGARTLVVDVAREHFLTRARRAGNHDRGVARGDLGGKLQKLARAWVSPNRFALGNLSYGHVA